MYFNYIRQVENIAESFAPDGYAPTRTGKAYKVFRVKNGELYPPMVANPGGTSTPVGVWLTADEGEFAGLSKTGRPQVKSTGSGKLAYRPGWHLGDLPIARQFYRTNKLTGEREFPKDFVWAECDYVMDVDYQNDADEQGYIRTKPDGTSYRSDKYQHSLAGLQRMPKDGFYRYRTNPDPTTVPWVITGAMRVNKILSDVEVKDILAAHGIEAPKREGGDKTVQELGLTESLLLEDLEALKQYFPKVDEETFYKLIKLDPTYRTGSNNAGTYGKWLLQLANKNNGQLESEGHATDVLTRFDEVKKQLKNKDIGKFKSIAELEDYLNDENSYTELSDRQRLRLTQKAVRNSDLDIDAEKLFENSTWEVWVPKTYEASCKLGQGTSWCTASTASDYYYNSYVREGPLYININKSTGEKFQFHFESHQYMDTADQEINLVKFFEDTPELKDFYARKLAPALFGKQINSMDEMITIYFSADDLRVIFEQMIEGFRTISGETAFSLLSDPYEEIIQWYLGDDILDPDNLPDLGETSIKVLSSLGLSQSDAENIFVDKVESPYSEAIRDAYFQGAIQGYTVGTAEAAHNEVVHSLYICLKNRCSKCWYNRGDTEFYVQSTAEKFLDEYFSSSYEGLLFEEALKDLISSIIIDSYKCFEPADGWVKFEDEAFDSTFAQVLSEYID